ncbi:MAG: hypothetical protein MGG37_08145 [Trichodesmium sp. MAG_R01]|nr:hypothetical protein [Trichodesmium sp. MAG_R01]
MVLNPVLAREIPRVLKIANKKYILPEVNFNVKTLLLKIFTLFTLLTALPYLRLCCVKVAI